MASYLDKEGLSYLWGKLKLLIEGKAEASHVHAAGDITSGTFSTSRIPSLKASKITSGTFGVARGGTGKSSVTSGSYLVGDGTSAMTEKTPEEVLAHIGAAAAGHSHDAATESTAGFMSAADKAKLDGIATGANAYSHPTSHPASMITGLATVATSGSYNDLSNKPTIPAAYSHPSSHPASMITGLAAVATSGSYNDLSNKPTIPTYSAATTSAAGLMSASDKSKLDGITAGANKYTHPSYTAKSAGLYKVTVDSTGHVSAVTAVAKSDITALGIPEKDTTYSAAGSSLGLVKSGGDVTISSGVISVNDDSHNHTIANVDGLQSALDGKANKSTGIFYIAGTGSTEGEWLGSYADITEYYDGLTVAYKVGIAGASSTTLNINSLGAVKVVRNTTTAVTTHYGVNAVLILVYTVDSDGTAYWKVSDYDSDTKTRSSNKTGSKMYIIGASTQSTSGQTTYSNKNCYIGTDNCLYSGGEKTMTESDIVSITNAEIDTLMA